MKNLKMFCLNLYDENLENIKKIKYIPVGLGKNKFRNSWVRDNNGENISEKNPYYGEYTFHYWFWKNMLHDIPKNSWIGFCHYRRFWANDEVHDYKKLNEIVNNKNFYNFILKKANKIWNDYEVILIQKQTLGKIKLMKILKNGGIYPILKNFNNFIKNYSSIKFHFDCFHGCNKIDKAINLLIRKEKNDFIEFVNRNNSFSQGNMFICRSKKIINEYYKSIFRWLYDCENLFGFKFIKYNEIRIYAYLAERYLPFWFNKYTSTKEWPFFWFDTKLKKLKLL